MVGVRGELDALTTCKIFDVFLKSAAKVRAAQPHKFIFRLVEIYEVHRDFNTGSSDAPHLTAWSRTHPLLLPLPARASNHAIGTVIQSQGAELRRRG